MINNQSSSGRPFTCSPLVRYSIYFVSFVFAYRFLCLLLSLSVAADVIFVLDWLLFPDGFVKSSHLHTSSPNWHQFLLLFIKVFVVCYRYSRATIDGFIFCASFLLLDQI